MSIRQVLLVSAIVLVPGLSYAAIQINDSVTINGDLNVTGALSKGSGSFVIDHPLDPKNKQLYHSFVESPDVMNTYVGRASLDSNGRATIYLPGYFLALNKDFRYFATPVGTPMPALHLDLEVRPQFLGLFGTPVFSIEGGMPEGSVSWMVTGIRHDPYILSNPVTPQVEKGLDAPYLRGEYVHPDVYASSSRKK